MLQYSDLETTMQENLKSHEIQKSKHRVIFMPWGESRQKKILGTV